MAPLPIETIPTVSSLAFTIIPSLFFSLILLTLMLFKCLHRNIDNTAHLIAASRTSLNNVTNPIIEEKRHNSPPQTVIIDEPTLKELDAGIVPTEQRNASMMNLLFSNTPQSSVILSERDIQSVSTENILVPDSLTIPTHSSKISKDTSCQSFQNATVVENSNVTEESVLTGNISVQDGSMDPEYDEVNASNHYAAVSESHTRDLKDTKNLAESPVGQKPKLKFTLSDEMVQMKPSGSNPAIFLIDPPQLPARNMRIGSMPSNSTRPIITKPVVDGGEEFYESIQDEALRINTSPSSNPCSDENDYASVDHDNVKTAQNPPSLPAPRLPIQKEALKIPITQDVKKSRKKNRLSLRDKGENQDATLSTPNEPNDENHPQQRKKAKSFVPFTKKANKKAANTDHSLENSPNRSFESSTELFGKQDRGALPPVPAAQHSASSDSEEGYSCIQNVMERNKTPILSRESKSSSSSAEGPYSELKFDPKKKRTQEKAAEKVIAVEYEQKEDGNTSPMEIDEPYSCIDDVKSQGKDKSPLTPNDPMSDLEIAPRALPLLPTDQKIKVPHQYVNSEEIKRRKWEQRDRKEEERRLSEVMLIQNVTQNETQIPTEKIEEVATGKKSTTTGFLSLKSIFSDFRKDEDIVTQTISHVLGLAPPEPPHDSDDDSHSYASVAQVREQKRAKKVTPEPPVKSDGILTQQEPQLNIPILPETDTPGIDLNESIGDHTYSTLVECQPYEEPKLLFSGEDESIPMYEDINTEPKTPMYEVPEELNVTEVKVQKGDDEPRSKVSDPTSEVEQEYATPRFEGVEPQVNEKVSQDLSKLREHKGYVKVSHQKENMPEYASIDDVKSGSSTTLNNETAEPSAKSDDDVPLTVDGEIHIEDSNPDIHPSIPNGNELSRQSPEIARDIS